MAGEQILYVEDNHENRMLIKRVLEVEGFNVIEAETGRKGFEKAKETTPDLILMDINLPDIDGYAVTALIRDTESLKHIPILAVTANVMAGDRQKVLDAGCDDYIPKPIDIDRLPSLVREYLGKKHGVMEPTNAPASPVLEKKLALTQSAAKAPTVPPKMPPGREAPRVKARIGGQSSPNPGAASRPAKKPAPRIAPVASTDSKMANSGAAVKEPNPLLSGTPPTTTDEGKLAEREKDGRLSKGETEEREQSGT